MTMRFIRGRRRIGRCEKGAAAVEFALLSIPFLWLLLATFEMGLMLLADYVVQDGVSEAARMIRTGQVQKNGISASQFKNIICGKMSFFLDCDGKLYVDVRKFDDFASIDIPPALNEDGELNDDLKNNPKFETGQPMQVVVARAYYTWKLHTPFLNMLSNMSDNQRLLTASAAFRNEPYSNDDN